MKEIQRGKCWCGTDAYITVIQWQDVERVFHLCLEHGQGRLLDDIEERIMEECPECKDLYVEENMCDECGKCVIWCCTCDSEED